MLHLCKLHKRTQLLNLGYVIQGRKNSSISDVIFEDHGNKGLVIINRPKIVNSLTFEMLKAIHYKLKDWKHKKLIVMKGVKHGSFSSGMDLITFKKKIEAGGYTIEGMFTHAFNMANNIATFPATYVAMVNGIAMGGGAGIAYNGQFRVGTENTVFAMPEVSIGYYPDVAAIHFFNRMPGKFGLFLALTGHKLKGVDTLRAGFATHFCDSCHLDDLEHSLFSINDPSKDKVMKVLQNFSEKSLKDKGKEFSLDPFLSKINKLFEGDSITEILTNLKRDGSDFASEQLRILEKCPPTSLSVTLEYFKRVKHMTVQECLVLDLRVAHWLLSHQDVHEGIRAMFIDKDKSPKWKPSTLEEMTQDTIDRYFLPIPNSKDLCFD